MKKYIGLLLIISMLFTGCTQNNTAEPKTAAKMDNPESPASWAKVTEISTQQDALEALAKPLPYQEEAGTLTQYRNFIRGDFELNAQNTYTLLVTWNENTAITMYCIGQNGHEEEIPVASGVPVTITVPVDGLYRIQAPLNGDEITGLTFSLSMADSEPTL